MWINISSIFLYAPFLYVMCNMHITHIVMDTRIQFTVLLSPAAKRTTDTIHFWIKLYLNIDLWFETGFTGSFTVLAKGLAWHHSSLCSRVDIAQFLKLYLFRLSVRIYKKFYFIHFFCLGSKQEYQMATGIYPRERKLDVCCSDILIKAMLTINSHIGHITSCYGLIEISFSFSSNKFLTDCMAFLCWEM